MSLSRREFLQALAAAGVAAAVPLAEVEDFVGRFAVTEVRHMESAMDYDSKIGLAAALWVGGTVRRRHAVIMNREDWEAMSEAQRAEVWTRLDAAALGGRP